MAKKKKVEITTQEQSAELVAEEAVNEALPEITEENINEVKEAPAVKPKRTRKKTVPEEAPAEAPVEIKEEKPAPAVKSFSIEGNAWLYFTAVTPTASKLVSGTVYAWGEENSGRLPVTKNPDGAGNLIDLLGWVDIDKLK